MNIIKIALQSREFSFCTIRRRSDHVDAFAFIAYIVQNENSKRTKGKGEVEQTTVFHSKEHGLTQRSYKRLFLSVLADRKDKYRNLPEEAFALPGYPNTFS
jgi:hypothetical protein